MRQNDFKISISFQTFERVLKVFYKICQTTDSESNWGTPNLSGDLNPHSPFQGVELFAYSWFFSILPSLHSSEAFSTGSCIDQPTSHTGLDLDFRQNRWPKKLQVI